MTRRIADIEARGDEAGAVLSISIGALHIRLELSNDARMALCRALLGGKGECHADVSVGPLALPRGMREVDERTLNARRVERAGRVGEKEE